MTGPGRLITSVICCISWLGYNSMQCLELLDCLSVSSIQIIISHPTESSLLGWLDASCLGRTVGWWTWWTTSVYLLWAWFLACAWTKISIHRIKDHKPKLAHRAGPSCNGWIFSGWSDWEAHHVAEERARFFFRPNSSKRPTRNVTSKDGRKC